MSIFRAIFALSTVCHPVLLRFPPVFHHPSGYSNTWQKQREDVEDRQKLSLFVALKSTSEMTHVLRERLLKSEVVSEVFFVRNSVRLFEVLGDETDTTRNNLSPWNHTLFDLRTKDFATLMSALETSIIAFIFTNNLPTADDLYALRDSHFRDPYSILHHGEASHRGTEVTQLSREYFRANHTPEGMIIFSNLCSQSFGFVSPAKSVLQCSEFSGTDHRHR